MDFILYAYPGIVQDEKVVGKICLDLRKEWQKLICKKTVNELALRGKVQEFGVSLRNRFEALTEETDLSVDAMNGNLTSIVKECIVEVDGTVIRKDTGKLSQETKNIVKTSKHESLKCN